uniref:non-specific serine/threonine protein kinase n=1 Tax=Trypanosoma congolense (strain IL3000) TaxID=1068625 RepID=G0UQ08_TRYCI|nr:putative protein kinase [Trypanosoma congolense IL3000]
MDRFTKVRNIGKGNMGACVLVRNNEDGKLYVIKQVDLTKMNRKERQQSLNEAHVLKSLQHPNIINYVDSFLANRSNYVCIVMEYADGGDLSSRIKKSYGVNFRESQIVDWIIQLTLSLSYVHKRKILHRDVKAQNVFLTSQNILKLGDFGIARTLSGTYDQAKTFVGTPYYLSPELIMERPYDHRSDVWALGVIIYELMTLKHPFNATNMKGLMQRILKLQYEPIPPLYTTELRNIVPRILTRDPAQRIRLSDILDLPIIQRRLREWMLTDSMPRDYVETLLRDGLLPSNVAALWKSTVVAPRVPTLAPIKERPVSSTSTVASGPREVANTSATSPPVGSSKPTKTPEKDAPSVPLVEQRNKDYLHQVGQQQQQQQRSDHKLIVLHPPSGSNNTDSKGRAAYPRNLYINYKNFNGGYNSCGLQGCVPARQNLCVPGPSRLPTSGVMSGGIAPSNFSRAPSSGARHFTAILGRNRPPQDNVAAAASQSNDCSPTGPSSNATDSRLPAQPNVVPNSVVLQRLNEHRVHKRAQQGPVSNAMRLNSYLPQPSAPQPLPYLAGVQQLDIKAMLQRATLERARRNAT